VLEGKAEAMRIAGVVTGILVLACGSGDTVAAGTSPPPQVILPSQFPPPLPPTPPPPPMVITVGDVITGTVRPETISGPIFGPWVRIPGVYQIDYVLIAPADGTLLVTIDQDHSLGTLGVFGDGFEFSHFPVWPDLNYRGPQLSPSVGILPVVAGRPYRFSVASFGWELWDTMPFVLTTSIEPGLFEIPPGCTSAPPPVLEWLCTGGGWVPRGHPLAEPAPAVQPLTPTPPQATAASVCPSIKPGADWVCMNGGWLPPGHPDLSASPNPAPPPPPPVLTNTCATSDPFAGIPGLSGVCINGGWVPIGHPLVGGGAQ
jgi:hypothetical protein